MVRLIGARLLMTIPVLFTISVIVFLMIHSAPGDRVTLVVGAYAHLTPEQEAAYRKELGLLDPLPVQYAKWCGDALRGNLGRSFMGGRMVSDLIAERLPATIELTLCAMLVGVTIGIPAGIISAYKRHTWFDHGSMLVALTGVSMPEFWLGLVVMFVFAAKLRWLPVSGRLTAGIELTPITNFYLLDSLLCVNLAAFVDVLKHLALPALTLGSVQTAFIARMTRACMLEILQEDYIRTARAKGLRERVVLLRHAFRNAAVPVVTVIGLDVGFLLGGAVMVETVFSWPGMGKLIVESVLLRDYPTVQGVAVVAALIFVTVNMVADILYVFLNPEIRYV
jgi:ABC-type dipeptide/oligopeptide/nickel transport system permease component